MEHVKRAFDAVAAHYDAQRKYIIPDMDDFYGAAAWAADWPGNDPLVLDIGAGTGLLSALILGKFPLATLTLLDISEGMLEVARKRFLGCPRVRFVVADYSRADLPGKYDIVCSALSIHHLEHEDKRQLFRKIYQALSPGGIFVNADQVKAPSDWLSRKYREYWDSYLALAPIDPGELEAARVRRETLDKNALLLDQVRWLAEAGFSGVDVVYKNRTFCVFVGKKGEEGDD
ncbi:MAG: methyltransferase domain-containing protein [Methanolinea sp.]|jgi:tRNA (cmo5U34)-methyltransferase|nr:methyltransferase domain-containing protein [Methanolinea sp.]